MVFVIWKSRLVSFVSTVSYPIILSSNFNLKHRPGSAYVKMSAES